MKALLTFVLLLGSNQAFAMPEWAKHGSQQRVGDKFLVVCNGQGPALDIARAEAVNSCRLTASEQLVSEVRVKTLAIGTNQDSAFHQEVSKELNVTGLNCVPKNEAIEEKDSVYTIWLRCEFDLKKTEVIPTEASKGGIASLPSSPNESPKMGTYTSSGTKRLSIATVPQCESVLIQGEKPRSVSCKSNPTTLLVEPGDLKLTLRANGYKPKVIELNGGLKTDEQIQIIFD